MVINTSLTPNDTLATILAARARAASDGRLVLDVIVGVVGAIGIAALKPPVWIFPSGVAICVAMFGAWGIADREIAERISASRSQFVRTLRIVRLLTALAGIVAATVAALAAFSAALGTWIS